MQKYTEPFCSNSCTIHVLDLFDVKPYIVIGCIVNDVVTSSAAVLFSLYWCGAADRSCWRSRRLGFLLTSCRRQSDWNEIHNDVALYVPHKHSHRLHQSALKHVYYMFSVCLCLCSFVTEQLLASLTSWRHQLLCCPVSTDALQRLPHVSVPRRSWRHIGRRSIWKGSKLYNHSQNILCKITLYNDSALIHVLFVTAATTCLNDDRYVINCFSIPLLVHRRSWRHIRQSERQSTGKDTRIGQLLASITSWRHEMLCCRIRCRTHSHFDVALYVRALHTLTAPVRASWL